MSDIRQFLILLLTVPFLIQSCNSKPSADVKKHNEDLAKLESTLKNLADQITSVQGTSQCLNDSECKIVGLGAKTCGLYSDFLIYSTRDANEAKLIQYVNEFHLNHEKIIDQALSANHCGKKATLAYCVNHKCTAEYQK